MKIKFVVGYDGSPASDGALEFALKQAKLCDATLLLVHILEWSPYSFLTPQEIEERHARRTQELKRAQEALIDPLVEKVKTSHADVEGVIRYGNIVDTLMKVTKESGASQIFLGRTGHSSLSQRVFGSVAGSLAQHSTVPVTIVP